MDEYNILGSRIKHIRQMIGLSQTDLAKKLNCTQAALSQYEKGAREPGLNDLVNIANSLNTTTDYLLGITDVWSRDITVKNISNYFGLDDESIKKLHEMYLNYRNRIEEESIAHEASFYSDALPGDEDYIKDYNMFKNIAERDLQDYKKTINKFICSNSFSVLISCLIKNLYLERSTYDMIKIIERQYDSIEEPYSKENHAEQAYSLSEDGENNIRYYSLNIFDIQTAIINFCQNFTKLEEVKKLEYSEAFFRKMVYFIYSSTRSMFEKGSYSVEEMENKLVAVKKEISHTKKLLENYK